MAIVPSTLEAWTLDAVVSVVADGVFEARSFDFKEMLPAAGDERGKSRLRRTLAAFANSNGGFLIIGVKDDRALPATERLVGVGVSLDVPTQLKDHVVACTPTIQWTFLNEPLRLLSGRLIHVIHVLESRAKPHGVLESERWVFPKRTEGGNGLLSYEEIRDTFRDQNKVLNSLKTIRVEAQRMKIHAEHLNAGFANDFYLQYIFDGFRPGFLEAALLQVLGYISTNDVLVSNLQELRSAATAADAETQRFLATNQLKILQDFILRVGTAATQVVHEIDRLFGSRP
jgi:hypothetical protein